MENLKRLRKQNHLTQKDLAGHIGVSQSNIADWESGKKKPNLESLITISNFFSITIDELLNHPVPEISPKSSKISKEDFSNSSPYIEELLNNFQSLTPKNQIKLIAFSQELVELEENEHSKKGQGGLSTSQIS